MPFTISAFAHSYRYYIIAQLCVLVCPLDIVVKARPRTRRAGRASATAVVVVCAISAGFAVVGAGFAVVGAGFKQG